VLRDITGNTINVSNQAIISDVASGSRLLNLTNLDVDQGAIRLTPPATVNPQNDTGANVNHVTVRMATGTTNAAGQAIYKEFVFEFNNDDNALVSVAGTTSVDVNGDGNNDEIQRPVVSVNIGNSTSLTPQAELGRLVDAMKAHGIGARVNNDGTIDIFGAGIDLVAFRIEAGTNDMVGALQRRYDTTTGLATNTWDVGTYDLDTQAFTAGAGAGQYARVIGGSASDGNATQTTPDSTTTEFTNASSAIAVVDEAIRMVNTIVAELGARLSQVEGQQEFTKQLTDSIREGLGALVDADLAEESARLTSLQTKQQLAIQSLSIANQQGQALLGLFR